MALKNSKTGSLPVNEIYTFMTTRGTGHDNHDLSTTVEPPCKGHLVGSEKTQRRVLVPKDLTFDQKNARKETASLNLEATTDDPELLKHRSGASKMSRDQRRRGRLPGHVDGVLRLRGIVHHEFQQQGSTITADSYLGVLRRLREAIRQKRPELWRSKSWILHHDNAPAHTALKISKFLQDHSTSVFPHPPYSPDLAPCDFFLFGKLKKKLKGRKFQSIEEIKILSFLQFSNSPNSVRHNLSLNKSFEKVEQPVCEGSQRKRCLWAMNPAKVDKLDEELHKCTSKDPGAIRRSMANPAMDHEESKPGLAIVHGNYVYTATTSGGAERILTSSMGKTERCES
ncbi:hypothetical protein LAZ67_22000395 [Cordylochernes scorpioides]|uniref:Fork-head domain-containing protein n=1 Tax=Cordylochernes scorpioides TaxID=51811 RepID=A0ABY6LNA3_9ARAC|nr:hypothetical protein LAZ67_22000395 [Cordylochernes scorpioides]